MALYKRGRWNILPEELNEDALDGQYDKVATWLESIALALSAGDSEVAALDKSLAETDNVVLAAATIHAIYGIQEGLTLSEALKSFAIGRWSLLMNLIELGLVSGKLDVVLKQAAFNLRAESQEEGNIPAESPIASLGDWLVFYTLAVMADAGYPIMKALCLMKDRFSRDDQASRERLWQVTKVYLLIKDGYILSEALDETGFSPAIVDGAREGERNGNLDVAFARWTGYEPTQHTA
jgi:type II secretory pathway component PulF